MKRTLLGLLVVAIGFACTAWGQDPADQEEGPGRGVARISVMNGDVSVRRGDSGEVVAAALNAPLAAEDQLLTGPDSRAEVQFDWANMVRLAASSEVRLAELENGRYQLQVARGMVTFSVLRDSNAQVEVSTPVVSVRPVKNGSYRIAVREDGTTEISVRSGEVEIFTPRGSERLTAGRTMVARGTAADPEFQVVQAAAYDDWDRWNESRDQQLAQSQAYNHVNRDVYGAEDLDSYGSWQNDSTYGDVWYPRVAEDWAPYRDGRWSWMDWYGWNWVSYDPWGWAPYHYGRWFNNNNRWGWWPGDRYGRQYWSPGLVAFVGWDSWGGIGGGLGFGGVGWIPLAPYERYYPWYGNRFYAGYRNGGRFGNGSNLVNNFNFNSGFRNARVRNGITGIDGQGFVNGRRGSAVQLGNGQLGRASLVRGMLPVTPGRESLRVSDRAVRTNGGAPQGRNDGRFFSRQQPARVDRVPFEDQRRGMDQVARQTFGGQRSSPAVNAGGQAGRSGQGTSSLQRGAASVDVRSGRQAGNGAPAGNLNATGANGRSQVNGNASPGNSTATGANGWRRFGQPLAGEAQGTAGRPQDRSSGVGRQAPQSSQSNVQGGGANSNSRDGWRSFGTGSPSSPRTMDSGQNSRSNSGSVAPRSASPQSPRTSAPQVNGNGGQSQVRVNPPIVRERAPSSSGSSNYSRSAPSSSGGNYSRSAPSSNYSRPAPSSGGNYSRSAPSSTYSRPAPSSGGGNYSRPAPSGGGSYSRSAPSSGGGSRPAPSSGGGNRSTQSSGGGNRRR